MEPVNHACGVGQEDLGPFLLGQLDGHRSTAVAAQVAACPTCSAEVERLRPVVAALARSSPPPAEPGERNPGATGGTGATAAPVSGADRTVPRRRRPVRRSPRRRRLAVGATALVLVAAVGSVVLLNGRTDVGERVALAGAPGVSASAVLQERRWGTAIELEVRGLDAGTVYGVWLERREGGRVPAGTFRPDGSGTFRLALASAEQLDDSRAVGIAELPGGRVADAVDVAAATLP